MSHTAAALGRDKRPLRILVAVAEGTIRARPTETLEVDLERGTVTRTGFEEPVIHHMRLYSEGSADNLASVVATATSKTLTERAREGSIITYTFE